MITYYADGGCDQTQARAGLQLFRDMKLQVLGGEPYPTTEIIRMEGLAIIAALKRCGWRSVQKYI